MGSSVLVVHLPLKIGSRVLEPVLPGAGDGRKDLMKQAASDDRENLQEEREGSHEAGSGP